MTTITSPAARTISILRSLCEQVGLRPDKYLRRLATGHYRHSPDVQVASTPDDFDSDWAARVEYATVCAALAVARGLVSREDPRLQVYMLAAKRMADAQAAMLSGHERDAGPACHGDCTLCDVDLDSVC